ncbi:Alpha/beta hydrolase fold-3 [Dillenia turbinata]|uniref:Alpha/beta hydrolase fold-3 n=1 Tax=Dillenia turbinata TaxID=194707 RepID=A0AAN8YY28_9MAGN
MESTNSEVIHEFRFFRVYKDGTIERFIQTDKIPPSLDPETLIQSKDVVVSTEPAISVRVFIPSQILAEESPGRKLPVLFYVHGGGFSFRSAFSAHYHKLMNTVASKANLIGVSVEYRKAPEHPIPACYDDSWAALQWVAAHVSGHGPEEWLNKYADFQRVFLAGDSAGGNITHTLLVRVGRIGLPGVKVIGAALFHPYFGGTGDDKMWLYMCPTNTGLNDRRLKPDQEDLALVGCDRVLVYVAELDHLKGVGINYYEELKKSGWGGSAELVETKGEDHCFHLHGPRMISKAVEIVDKFVAFIKD